MDLQSLKDVGTIKSLFVDIWSSLSAEVKKLKDVNKDNFLSAFKQYFFEFLKAEYKKINQEKLNYFKFDGRVSRKQYWMFQLFACLLVLAIKICVLILPFMAKLFILLYFVLALITLIPNISLAVRRLHDINFSGWWCIIAFAPYVGFLLLILLAFHGDKKANNFGPVVK